MREKRKQHDHKSMNAAGPGSDSESLPPNERARLPAPDRQSFSSSKNSPDSTRLIASYHYIKQAYLKVFSKRSNDYEG